MCPVETSCARLGSPHVSIAHASPTSRNLRLVYLPSTIASIMLACGSGKVPAGFLVFKTCGGSRCGPRWVRLPSTPAPCQNRGAPRTPFSPEQKMAVAECNTT